MALKCENYREINLISGLFNKKGLINLVAEDKRLG